MPPFRARRRTAAALGFSAVAVAASVAVVLWGPGSGAAGGAAATEPPGRTGSSNAKAVEIVEPAPRVIPQAPASSEAPVAIPAASTPSATPAPSLLAADSPVPEDGVLRTPARASQHRIYVDRRVIGEGVGEFKVKCGPHTVRVGSQGEDRDVEIPCGGTREVE